MHRRVLIAVSALLACLAAGCTSMRTVQTPEPREAVAVLAPGDTVQLVMADGSKLRLTVAAIEADELVGTRGERVAIDDLHIVSVRRFDSGKSAVAAFGTVVLAVSAAAIALLAGS
jgi:hypothetical protein